MTATKSVDIGAIRIGQGQPLTIMAGPCVVEGEGMILDTAGALKEAVADLPVQFLFKASYRKANRTSLTGFSGLDSDEALGILGRVRTDLGLPIVTDIHTEAEAADAAEVADVLQIPAFLSRQTDLLVAAGRTGRAVNIKKGQFLAPEDMEKAAAKVADTGNEKVLLTERGTTFGYRNLVVDMRGLVIMARTGRPVIFDATHSTQLPGGLDSASGGQPEFILPLASAALATGAVSGLFMEVHPDPPNALSDAATQLRLGDFRDTLERLLPIYEVARNTESDDHDAS